MCEMNEFTIKAEPFTWNDNFSEVAIVGRTGGEGGRMSSFLYRACKVNGEEAVFHCWEQWSQIIEPSLLKGGHSGGQISQVFGIVEFQNGSVERIQPYDIEFIPDELVLKRNVLKRKKVD